MGTKVCSLSSFSSGHHLFFSFQSALLHKSLSPSKTLESERPTPILPFIHSLPLPPSPHNHLHSSPRPPLTPHPSSRRKPSLHPSRQNELGAVGPGRERVNEILSSEGGRAERWVRVDFCLVGGWREGRCRVWDAESLGWADWDGVVWSGCGD